MGNTGWFDDMSRVPYCNLYIKINQKDYLVNVLGYYFVFHGINLMVFVFI
jgi:hypothetical protein